MKITGIKGFIIDFDGTISKNSAMIMLKFIYGFITSYKPVPYHFILSYYKNATAFRSIDAVRLLFSSLGLEDKVALCLEKLGGLEEYNEQKVKIEPDFFRIF